MFGIRKRKELKKMKLIKKYEHVKTILIKAICKQYNSNQNFEELYNAYSITYIKESGIPARIRRTPDKKDINEIRYELGHIRTTYPSQSNSNSNSNSNNDSNNNYDRFTYICPMYGHKVDYAGYMAGEDELYDYFNEQ